MPFLVCFQSAEAGQKKKSFAMQSASSKLPVTSIVQANHQMLIYFFSEVGAPDPGYTHAMMTSQLPYNERETLLQI